MPAVVSGHFKNSFACAPRTPKMSDKPACRGFKRFQSPSDLTSVPVRALGDSETPKMPDKRACRGFRTFPEHPRRLISLPVGASDASKVLQATCDGKQPRKRRRNSPEWSRIAQNSPGWPIISLENHSQELPGSFQESRNSFCHVMTTAARH